MADGYWFYAIILGGAFAQCARDLAKQVRDRVRAPEQSISWPAVLWQIFLLLLTIEVFIALTAYRADPQQRSVLDFLAFLAIPVGIFMASMMLEADGPAPEGDDALTPAEAFKRRRAVFFTIIILIPVVNIIHELVLRQEAIDADLGFQLLIAIGGVAGLLLRRPGADVALAAAMIVVITAYIATSYPTLTF